MFIIAFLASKKITSSDIIIVQLINKTRQTKSQATSLLEIVSIEIIGEQFSRSNTINLSASVEITCNLGRYFIYFSTAPRLRIPRRSEIARLLIIQLETLFGRQRAVEVYLLVLQYLLPCLKRVVSPSIESDSLD